ncbi:MAG TPA: MFS transporter [Vitreimonas sp.]|nr:MFS transporter [Vitreimonas sp.]
MVTTLFPFSHLRNIALFYVLSAVYNAWVVAGVWVFVWGRFMTKTQIGVSDAFTFAIGFLVELPSGVMADIIGRKKAIVIGNVLLMVGNLLIAVSSSFFSITGWYLVWTIGYAFQSGATEALAYDTLRQAGHEKEWSRVMATAMTISRISTLVSTAAGGYLFMYWFRLPYLVFGLISIIGVLAALSLKEIKVSKVINTWSWRSYVTQIKDGVAVLVRPQILPIALVSLTMMGIGYMYNWGLVRPLTGERFGYTPEAYSLLLGVISVAGIIALTVFTRLQHRFKTELSILILALAYALNFALLSGSYHWLIGGGVMISLAVWLLYIDVLFSQFINLHTREEHRATTLSTVALFTRLPYVVLAIVIGRLADNNLVALYTLTVGCVGIMVWIVALALYWRSRKLTS